MDHVVAPSHPLRPYYVSPEPVFPSAVVNLPPAPDDGEPYAGPLLRATLVSLLLAYASTALVMPFEVGKTLAMVQWVPKHVQLPPSPLDDDEDEEPESYFDDIHAPPAPSTQAPFPLSMPTRPLSPSGYLLRTGINDELFGTKPEWILPVVVQGGVWDMMRSVGRWQGEGWGSLWKGQLTTCVQDACTSSLQPLLLSSLTLLLPSSSLLSLPLIHSPRPIPLLLLSVLSHTLTTLLLSPIDLVRTRLIVQSNQPRHRKYSGPLHAIKTILAEEGGLRTLYLHPHLFLPALLEGAVRPLLFLSTPLIISRILHLEPSSTLFFGLAECTLGTIALLFTLPLETIRKRLQIQIRAEFIRGGRIGGVGRAWRSCVEVRPESYSGMVDCFWRILTEETARIPRRRRPSHVEVRPAPPTPTGLRPRSASSGVGEDKTELSTVGLGGAGGIGQLYRGFGMGLGANGVIFLLGLISGAAGGESGRWTEM